MSNQKVVAITGASNGMGKAALELFAQQGWIVYGGARHVDNIPTGTNTHALYLDVTDDQSIVAFGQTILDEQHRIDVLINNAGYGENGPVEDTPMTHIRRQFDTNFFGAVALTQFFLPTMRAQHAGRVVNISSVGGDIYSPLGAYYHASKAALQQWSDTLDLEVEPFGIRSVVVQPGGTQSSWGSVARANIQKNLKPDTAYQSLVTFMTGVLDDDAPGMGASAQDLAQLFYRAATDVKPKQRYFNNFRDHLTVITARALPGIFRWSIKRSIDRAK
ncbi:SDR family NAD(P)-dependent oxidoreductase [Lacticaseibacillus saniviri]|uniref:SDR family NAD(P)-dependent oxidoreductase n=1 Tax=Lacticaseibacillus saniviri TaxID=931533 RepID=UPI001EDDDE6E|nr:SDR family NAD(P)-dependent oxidoreductase [Lacticaseibacillus saniviri]MCG4282614.1 SDR family NAD(P)-dependent oxidoreductase [Lacticaseibacillus saniviri]